MRVLRDALIVILLGSMPAWAAPASEASIRELLAVTQAPKLLDDVRSQFDSLMDNSIRKRPWRTTPACLELASVHRDR